MTPSHGRSESSLLDLVLTLCVWVGRVGLFLVGALALLVGLGSITEPAEGLVTLVVGVLLVGGGLWSFDRTRTVGWWLTLGGLWALATTSAVTVLVDPSTAFSAPDDDVRYRIETETQARTFGAFLLVVSWSAFGAWAWYRVTSRRREAAGQAEPDGPDQRAS